MSMRGQGIAILMLVAGCGRLGFDPESARLTGDGGSLVDAAQIDAAPCVGAMSRNPIDTAGSGTWVNAIVGTPTQNGYGIAYVAPDGRFSGSRSRSPPASRRR